MAVLISALQTALPVLLALALGMLCRKTSILTRSSVDVMKRIVIDITLPAVLLDAFATAQYDRSAIIVPGIMFLVCCLALVMGLGFTKLFGLGRLPAFLATGFEAGMLGYALFVLLFPNESSSHFAIVDLGQVVFVNTVYKILLTGKGDKKEILRDIVRSPIIWSIVIGVILGATGLYDAMGRIGISGLLDSLTSFISAPTGMLILLVIGFDLDLGKIQWKDVFSLVCMRVVIMAVLLALVLALNGALLGGMMHTGAVILMFLLPPPYMLPIFSTDESQSLRLSSALSALTLVTMLLFTVMAAVL